LPNKEVESVTAAASPVKTEELGTATLDLSFGAGKETIHNITE